MADGEPFKSPKKNPSKGRKNLPSEDEKSNDTHGFSAEDYQAGKFVLEICQKVFRQGGGSGGEEDIKKWMDAVIHCGQTDAVIGSLGGGWNSSVRRVRQNQELLNRVAQSYWWGDDY